MNPFGARHPVLKNPARRLGTDLSAQKPPAYDVLGQQTEKQAFAQKIRRVQKVHVLAIWQLHLLPSYHREDLMSVQRCFVPDWCRRHAAQAASS